MANNWEKAVSILVGNLNSGHSYLITAVLKGIKTSKTYVIFWDSKSTLCLGLHLVWTKINQITKDYNFVTKIPMLTFSVWIITEPWSFSCLTDMHAIESMTSENNLQDARPISTFF